MIVVILLGITIGSFINICIYRIFKKENMIYYPLYCEKCSERMKWYDLISLISWSYLKGRCRKCQRKLNIQFLLIELISGIMFGILYLKFGFSINFISYGFLSTILLISAIVDLETTYVYTSISLIGIIVGITFSILNFFEENNFGYIIGNIGIPILLLGILNLFKDENKIIGLGDFEIFIMISCYLPLIYIMLSIFLSIIFGGFFAIIMIIKKVKKRYMPFVPYIAFGTFISIVYGNNIIKWYIEKMSL